MSQPPNPCIVINNVWIPKVFSGTLIYVKIFKHLMQLNVSVILISRTACLFQFRHANSYTGCVLFHKECTEFKAVRCFLCSESLGPHTVYFCHIWLGV